MNEPRTSPSSGTTRPEVESCPVCGLDGSVRGWVRLHTDRIHTGFAIVVDTTSFLDPYEARRFAQALEAAADQWEARRA